MQRMDITFLKIAILTIFILGFQSVLAYNDKETIEHIKQISKDFISKNMTVAEDESIDVQIKQLSSILQIPRCSNEIAVAFPKNANREQITSLEFTCNGNQTWHLLVPIDVQINTKVLVAKQTIPSKKIVTEDDIEFADRDKNHLFYSFFKNKNEVIGQVTTKLITAGSVLNNKNIQLPIIIHRNQVLSLVVKHKSITVTMQGIAKSDGSLNSTIKVYNPTSKHILDAIVVGSNKAEIVI